MLFSEKIHCSHIDIIFRKKYDNFYSISIYIFSEKN